MRFTVHRPPSGEVSLCWDRLPGGDVACGVHIGIARPRVAGDAGEDRLALAAFRCDVPTNTASLRCERSRNALHAPRSFVVEPCNQTAPPLATNRAVKTALLSHSNARSVDGAASRAGHRPHVEVLDPNGLKSARQIGSGFFNPVTPPIYFARSDSGDRQFGELSAIGAPLGPGKPSLQPQQPDLFTRCQARGVQKLTRRQGRGASFFGKRHALSFEKGL